MSTSNKPTLRVAQPCELESVWHRAFSDLAWKRFDAPYIPLVVPSPAEYAQGFFARLLQGDDAMLVDLDGEPIGHVSCYWEDEATRWLEAGIILYSSGDWGAGIGRVALILWISRLFDTKEVERVGLTTWSGNPRMIRCAEAVGFRLEGRLRRCRFHEGSYHDAIRMGVLREEWLTLHPRT